MPTGRSWVVAAANRGIWEVKTARESEVYYRPLDEHREPKGGWRPGLPPLEDLSVLPQSLREVLDIFIAASRSDEPC